MKYTIVYLVKHNGSWTEHHEVRSYTLPKQTIVKLAQLKAVNNKWRLISVKDGEI